MHIKNIRCIEEKLAEAIKCEFDKGIDNVNTTEMTKATDMLKDAAEAEYYARIAVAMEKSENENENSEKYMLKKFMEDYNEDDSRRYYDAWRYSNGRFAPKGRGTRRGYEEYMPEYHMTPEMYKSYPPEYFRDMDRDIGKMYYTDTGTMNMPKTAMRDGREGRSGISRRTYMETKEMHKGNTPQDKDIKMKDLDHYLNELSEDVKEMIIDATPEEKQLMKTKLSTLVTKL